MAAARLDMAEGSGRRPWRLVVLSVLAWFAVAAFFYAAPGIDRAVSALFFAPETCAAGSAATVCGSFPLASHVFWQPLRSVFHYTPIALAILVAVALITAFALRRHTGEAVRNALIALGAMLLGPGLIVNLFLKEHWGRPRPADTDLFGGTLPFVPAGQWSDACATNCSFVSGESSAIFWLLCLVPLFPARHRTAAFLVLFAVAALAAGMRVAFGGHYLSDAILGGLATLVAYALVRGFADWRFPPKRPA